MGAPSELLQRALRAWKRRWFSLHFMNLAGVVAAVVLFLCANVLVSRFYTRWDVTSAGLYTLSPATVEALNGLQQPVEVVVFLSQSDPLTSSVRYMLDAYQAHTTQLSTRFVDPDRNPAEFVALQREYGLLEGKTEDGRLATEASIVLVSGQRRWFVTTDDIVEFDEGTGQSRPQLEQVLTEGVVNLLGRERVRLCFTTGQGELDVASGGPQGLAELRRRLEQNNYAVSEVDLRVERTGPGSGNCRLMIVAAPSVPFSAAAAARLRTHVEAGGSLLVAAGPLVDDEGRILDAGLGAVTALAGAEFENNIVFEQDPSLRMPVGMGGEVFLASPRSHPVTKGLVAGDETLGRVLLQLAQGIQLAEATASQALLVSSDEALTVRSFRTLREGSWQQERPQARRVTLAAAAELGVWKAEGASTPARVALIGTPSPLWSNTWRQPELLAARRFVESLISWLAAQPKLVSVPEKPEQPAGLHLTEESFSEVQRYVLIYMPVTVALLGGLVLLRRRRQLPSDAADEANEVSS